MTLTLAKPKLTEEEFMHLPDDGRKYELVDGELKDVPTSFLHDVIGANILFALRVVSRGKGYLTIGQAGFRMTSRNIRCPDVSYTSKERLPNGVPLEGFGDAAPDLCIEIISPSEEPADMARKIREYFASGAVYVWHVFPETQSITVFTSPVTTIEYAAEDQIDGGTLLPELRVRVSDLFVLD